MATPSFEQFRALAERFDVTVKDCGQGHWQAQGVCLVNYYPFSKAQTLFVAGQERAVESGSYQRAIEVARFGPVRTKSTSRINSIKGRRERLRMLAKHPFCHWCRRPLSEATATLEHVVPLARGGSNRRENLTLACKQCNHERGSYMRDFTSRRILLEVQDAPTRSPPA